MSQGTNVTNVRRLTVAVTGGIGAGKSTLSALFGAEGGLVISSDVLAREVVAPGTPGLAALVDSFGAGILHPDGSLDRAGLASIVFADAEKRRRLEEMTHPLVRDRYIALVAQAPAGVVVVNDIPLLRSVTDAARYQLVIGIGADTETRITRLVARGVGESDARARVAAQIPDSQRRQYCDVWLSNDGNPGPLTLAAERLWQRIRQFNRNLLAGDVAGLDPLAATTEVSPETTKSLSALAAARLSAVLGPEHRLRPLTSVTSTVIAFETVVDSAAIADALAEPLTAAGFPRAFAGTAGAVTAADWGGRVHANADPGRQITLYVTVRGG